MSSCQICGANFGRDAFKVKEMMLGTRDEFEYFQCESCGCIQIKDIPVNIAEYYPGDKYYSFNTPATYFNKPWKNVIKGIRDYIVLSSNGKLSQRIGSLLKVDTLIPIVAELDINKNTDILDVGCGTGVLLYALRNAGYKKLLGIDPFIDSDIYYENNLKILKSDIYCHDQLHDIIMMHHSLEHMPDHHKVFSQLNRLLKKNGKLFIRIPVVGYAWEKYKTNWVQLDAPRHFFIHSKESIQILAEQHGFTMDKVIYDSAPFQFWGSELYEKNIPLTNAVSEYFSEKELLDFKDKSNQLNKERKGDQAAFIFKKI